MKLLTTLLGEFPFEVYDGLEALLAHSTGPHPLTRFGTTSHQAFTEIVWLVPQLGANPADFQLGTVEQREAVDAQRRFLRRFFERYLEV